MALAGTQNTAMQTDLDSENQIWLEHTSSNAYLDACDSPSTNCN